jgi:hypothetical protein
MSKHRSVKEQQNTLYESTMVVLGMSRPGKFYRIAFGVLDWQGLYQSLNWNCFYTEPQDAGNISQVFPYFVFPEF